MMKAEQLKIEDLDTIRVRHELADTAIIMLHGYGANMHDLFPLWELWNQKNFDWYFPNGPLSLGMGPYGGSAWFSIDIAKLEMSMRLGVPRDLSDSIPLEFDSTMEKLKKFIENLKTNYKKIVIGGFSQGAMCSSHLSLSLDVDGLILLSGNLIAKSKMPHLKKGLSFYQSHGQIDPILPIAGAIELNKALTLEHGMTGTLSQFSGGHEIPMKVINEVRDYLGRFSVQK